MAQSQSYAETQVKSQNLNGCRPRPLASCRSLAEVFRQMWLLPLDQFITPILAEGRPPAGKDKKASWAVLPPLPIPPRVGNVPCRPR